MIAIALLAAAFAQDPSELDRCVKAVPGYDRSGAARIVDDEGFLRRLSADLLGRDPSSEELKSFVAPGPEAKRSRKIDELLATDRFAEHWGGRLAGILIGDPEKLDLGRHVPEAYIKALFNSFTGWMTEQVRKDRPWDEIVRELIEARGDPAAHSAAVYKVSFAGQSDYPTAVGVGLARHFLGIRLDCARCHDHPFDKWTTWDFYGTAAFFSGERVGIRDQGAVFDHLEIELRNEKEMKLPTYRPSNPAKTNVNLASGGIIEPRFLFGGAPGDKMDRTKALADYLTGKSNSQFFRSFSNRVWAWLLGSGVVEPADNFNLRNKAVSAALLEALTRGFIGQGYRVKPLVHAICLTEIYQRLEGEKRGGEDSVGYWRNTFERPVYPTWHRPLGTKAHPLPVVFDPPKEWVEIAPRMNVKHHFRVPGKSKKTPEADLGLIYTESSDKYRWKLLLEEWSGQIFEKKTKTSTFEGKGQVTLVETTGIYPCNQEGDGPEPWLLLGAMVKFPAGFCYVRFSGPPATVEAWREEFLRLLKEMSPP